MDTGPFEELAYAATALIVIVGTSSMAVVLYEFYKSDKRGLDKSALKQSLSRMAIVALLLCLLLRILMISNHSAGKSKSIQTVEHPN